MKTVSVKPIGVIRSPLKDRKDAPRFYTDKRAPKAVVELRPAYTKALLRMKVGDEIVILTWLHRAHREVLRVHPQRDLSNPLTGVFSTRSPDRPNPVGLHRVKVLKISGRRLHIGPIEAIDGTPVIDIKPVVESQDG